MCRCIRSGNDRILHRRRRRSNKPRFCFVLQRKQYVALLLLPSRNWRRPLLYSSSGPISSTWSAPCRYQQYATVIKSARGCFRTRGFGDKLPDELSVMVR
jgi:hypothetical protein